MTEQPEALQLPTLPFAVFDEFGQPCDDRVRDHFASAFKALRAQIGQGVPDGWQMVPKEPTDEMLRAGAFRTTPGVAYRAMLAVAPPAQQQKPLLDEKKIEMWTNATIECCTHMACYMRGIEDAEAAHNIGEKE